MNRQLPIAEPLAYGYQFYAFPLAILATDPRTLDWVLSNYTQVAYDRLGSASPVPFCFYLYDYAASPWLEVVKATRSWVGVTGRDVLDLCRDALAAGYYPYLNVDEFHVPDRRPHQKWHRSHDILLCGVDDEAQAFTVYGYTSRRVMATTLLGYTDFARAYASLDEIDNDCHQVYFYRLREQADYPMRPHVVRDALDEYLTGRNCSTRFGMLQGEWERAYGTDSYQPLQGYLGGYLAGTESYDPRHFHVLWEHKRLMTERMRRLATLTGGALAPLVDRCAEIEADALALRNGMMRHEAKGRSSRMFIETSPARLARIRDNEQRVLREALAGLEPVAARTSFPDGSTAPVASAEPATSPTG